jgi:hypothetical protein
MKEPSIYDEPRDKILFLDAEDKREKRRAIIVKAQGSIPSRRPAERMARMEREGRDGF